MTNHLDATHIFLEGGKAGLVAFSTNPARLQNIALVTIFHAYFNVDSLRR